MAEATGGVTLGEKRPIPNRIPGGQGWQGYLTKY